MDKGLQTGSSLDEILIPLLEYVRTRLNSFVADFQTP
jgi:hypothetical protein